jgi:hypothetical protein
LSSPEEEAAVPMDLDLTEPEYQVQMPITVQLDETAQDLAVLVGAVD